MRDRWSRFALAAVVAQIPFELRYTLFGLSNLQWTFLALFAASVPLLVENRKRLVRDRILQAAALFVGAQWLAAAFAPEFHANALKAGARFTAGFLLLSIARVSKGQKSISRVWVISAAAAAVYALTSYAGLGFPWLFRTEEFYIGQVQRLSGSFEYPNTAAAYFAMSLPIIWWSDFQPAIRTVFAFLVWCAVVLTFSKGALLAVPIVIAAANWKKAAGLAAVGAAAYMALLPVNPYLTERFGGPSVQNPIAAEYGTPWNYLRQQPNTLDEVPLRIRNTGVTKWRSQGWWRIAVGYRWWNTETETFSKTRSLITTLPYDVGRDQTVELPAAFRTPAEPGKYLLVLELFGHDFDWFSRTGVIPNLIQADIQPAIQRAAGHIDPSALYRRRPPADSLNASVPRSALWRAALTMFIEHPLGVGPDNYRLEYGRYLGAAHWDTHIYSNNLYLELLTGSGVLGLAAFGLILAARRWSADAPSMAAGVFLIHGLVDVFLMTTPIYFAFWISLGTADYGAGQLDQLG